jgi:acetyl-CoA carboxylase biotin carboxylase subunit
VRHRGHAIECRIYAEDPFRSFAPSPGTIRHLILPQGPGIRNDNGVYDGFTVPIFYDPMLSKLIAHGADRDEAIARMKRALEEYRVDGIETTMPFYSLIMDDPDFRAAQFDTGYLGRFLERENLDRPADERQRDAAIVAAAIMAFEDAETGRLPDESESVWKKAGRLAGTGRSVR